VKEIGGHLIHFSSDYVFDGEAGPYSESAAARPISPYGRSKLLGEKRVAESGARHCIVRTCSVFSYDPGGTNFFMHIYERLKRGEKVRAFVDQELTPSYAPALARAGMAVAERGIQGLLHAAGRDRVSRLEFTRRVARTLGLPDDLIVPVRMNELGLKARRPRKAGLRTQRAGEVPEAVLPGLSEALREVTRAIEADCSPDERRSSPC
jgi:dTDP-4-dehydrorhamnose reductase